MGNIKNIWNRKDIAYDARKRLLVTRKRSSAMTNAERVISH